MQKTYNLNHQVVIYPNEKGWIKLREILQEEYNFDEDYTIDDYLERRTTKDNGFKEQLWEMMSFSGPLMFNGSNYLEHTNITLCDTILKHMEESDFCSCDKPWGVSGSCIVCGSEIKI